MGGSPELSIAHRMSVEEYERLTPYSERLEENWGKPPGNLNSNGQNLLVFGCHFGNVFVGVQPTFGYEGRLNTDENVAEVATENQQVLAVAVEVAGGLTPVLFQPLGV